MFNRGKNLTTSEFAGILVNDAITGIDPDWEDFKKVYSEDIPIEDKVGKKELLAARLGSILFVLRNNLPDRKVVVQVVDTMNDMVIKQLEVEINTEGVWDRAIEYFKIMDHESVHGRDAELNKTLLKNTNQNPIHLITFKNDMLQFVTRYVNVAEYLKDFKIK